MTIDPHAPPTLAERNKVLMERAKVLGDACYSPDLGLVLRVNLPAGLAWRWGFDAVQSSVWYALSLADWCASRPADGPVRERLNHLVRAMAALQDRDPESPTYGNLIWHRHWTEVKDRNAVSFWAPEAGFLWLHDRELLDGETQAVLAEALDRCVDGLDRHRVPWQYTNIFLLNILARLTLAEALSRADVLDAALADWRTWFTETDRGGLTEYNSPTYVVTALVPLARMLPLAPDERLAAQIETALRAVCADFCWHYHAGTGQLAGAMSRAYPDDWLSNSFTSALAYQQFGAPHRAVYHSGPFVAVSHWQAPEELVAAARGDKSGTTVRAAIPALGIRRATWFGRRTALGVKSGPAYGRQELVLTVCKRGRRQSLLFLHALPETQPAVYSELCRGLALLGMVIREARVTDGSPHQRARFVMGSRSEYERIEVDGAAWNGDYRSLAGGTLLALTTELAIGVRFAAFALEGGDPGAAVVLWDDFEHDTALVELVAWRPTLLAVAVQVSEEGAPRVPAPLRFDGATLTVALNGMDLAVPIPPDDRPDLPSDAPLLEAPGYVWRRGEWAR